ncbi:hypothetical protein N5P37_003685 [Trichoderma harzianum]|nr:hypothetical protein N5P37_003685 [Trichoderma harzianum]
MATLDALKRALRQKATSPTQPLSDEQYSASFDTLLQGPGWKTYQDFIFPQLSQVLTPLLNSRIRISVLEIGPGPKSVLGYLPDDQRRKINKYGAFEPNDLYATELQEWLETESPLPCLESLPDIHRVPFTLDSAVTDANDGQEKFDVVLFCHSMYGMKPKRSFIERALEMLAVQPEGGVVVVFHRNAVDFDGLVCHKTASFPSGTVCVADDYKMLDIFSSFIAGFVMQDKDADEAVHVEWRKVCRDLGRRQEAHPGHLFFSAPEVMMAFNHHATMLPELTAQVSLVKEERIVKNWEARAHRPASILRPTKIQHVQKCVQWALKHRVGLTVIGGGHSGHCLWPNVVALDMEAFDQVHVQGPTDNGIEPDFNSGSLIIAGAGCKTGDIVRAAMAASLTVPLGARPSVGAGLWLQGGLGHLARLYGLACDSIVGFIMVSVDSAQILCVGHVPNEYWPTSGVRPENEAELLWAMKGAGSNFGIVTSVIFKAYPAPVYTVRNWIVSLDDDFEARRRLTEFDRLIASNLPRNCSADAYLYSDAGRLQLGITMIEASATKSVSETPTLADTILEAECTLKVVDSVGLFDAEMYVSGMHGGHGGGKTSSFKRCLFLKDIGAADVSAILVAAVESRPTTLCYLHLLQGGGAVANMVPDATAFGCRDWEFACVITGVWPRHQDGTETAQATVQWVYHVARTLLPLARGVYGADLGPDPRDADLAEKAFGPNRPRLARLKRHADPCKVLNYACPLPEAPIEPKLIVLVTGEHGAGKDYCAGVWASMFKTSSPNAKARVVSISDVTKRQYAAATGADLDSLLQDRAYKEQHQPALTAFFQEQVRQRPKLPEEHFTNVVHGAIDVDILLITGMRDEAPVAALSHLVPDSRVLEVRVRSREETRRARGCCQIGDGVVDQLVLESHLLQRHAWNQDLQQLANMVRSVPDFPRSGIEFRHLLDISQQPGGLKLCVSLFRSHFAGDWNKIEAVVCCEAGGFIFASALASEINLPLVLIREAGKLPPPVVSVVKRPSHISHSASNGSREKKMEMERDVIRRGASVLVVDDVLATGETLCAVVQLLAEAGVSADQISVMVVAEFPAHRGRELMRSCGFGRLPLVTVKKYLYLHLGWIKIWPEQATARLQVISKRQPSTSSIIPNTARLNQASLTQLFTMGSTSQPSQSRPPLETLSIKQLIRSHPRDKLLVRPLEWTGRHLEVLQCSFEDSPPPSPSQEHLDEVDRIPAKESMYTMKNMAAGDVWQSREASIRYIVGSDDCPLRPYGTAIEFHFDGRCVSSLPCQAFTNRYGNKAAFEKGMAPVALVSIDCEYIKSLRFWQMLPRRHSKQAMGIHERHIKRVTPPNRLHDPYEVALLLAVAYNQRYRTTSSIWSRATFWPQVILTDREDEYVHLFAAHISSNYLNKFDFISRRPAKSAQQPLLIHHIPVPLKPYKTFRRRLLPILLHPADYYKGG